MLIKFFAFVFVSANLQQSWRDIQNHASYIETSRNIMDAGAGQFTGKKQMEAFIQLLTATDEQCNMADLIKQHQEIYFTPSPSGHGGACHLHYGPYPMHFQLRDIIEEEGWKNWQNGFRASLNDAFRYLLNSGDKAKFKTFFQIFQNRLGICVDAMTDGISLALLTAITEIGEWQWDSGRDAIQNFTDYMYKAMIPQICNKCKNNMKCKKEQWHSVRNQDALWLPAVEKSNGRIGQEFIKSFRDEFLEYMDPDFEDQEEYKCVWEPTPSPNPGLSSDRNQPRPRTEESSAMLLTEMISGFIALLIL